ncbi:hypothetical protein DB345_02135 [Spartobacteria bacterium LR76]|nr:hypothetical protein DB345_02135 [Spartobacteria bacterium LR76]
MVGKVMHGGYWLMALAVALVLACGVARAADVEQVYTIQLEKFDLPASGGGTYSKYGIWLSLGGSTTPQVFEFDTGGEGLYAAHSADAAWWGADVTEETTSIDKNFGSGLEYTGKVAKTSVAFYNPHSTTQVLATTAADYKVGKSEHIVNTDTSTDLWPPETVGGNPAPPVDGKFYGDFGLSLKKGDHGIENVFAQLSYGGGVTAGYIVSLGERGSSQQPGIQVGLAASDLTNPDTVWFTMAAGPAGDTFEHSGLETYAAELISASLYLSGAGGKSATLTGLGLNLDTGNGSPGILYQQDSADETALTPVSNVDVDGNLTGLQDGLQLTLVGTDANGNSVTLDQFLTGSTYGTNLVWEEYRGDGQETYMNIGQLLFEKYAVTYDLANGQLGLTPYAVPEPGTAGLLLGGAAALLAWRLNRRG